MRPLNEYLHASSDAVQDYTLQENNSKSLLNKLRSLTSCSTTKENLLLFHPFLDIPNQNNQTPADVADCKLGRRAPFLVLWPKRRIIFIVYLLNKK